MSDDSLPHGVYQGMWSDLPVQAPSVVCIGRFDGVHIGHQALIHQAKTLAAQHDCLTTALCFDPHPNTVFKRAVLPELTTLEQRFKLLHYYGVDHCVCLNFTQQFAALTAAQFLNEIILKRLQAHAVVVGENFRFGRMREGDVKVLQQWGLQMQVSVLPLSLVICQGQPVSTSRCRTCLADQDVLEKLIGRKTLLV
jgi:riboflavin kinase / FMN adenylyltransferase